MRTLHEWYETEGKFLVPPDYKVWWERDSTALGKALAEIRSLQAQLEDHRATLSAYQRALTDIRDATHRTALQLRAVADLALAAAKEGK